MAMHKSPRGVRPVRLKELPDHQRFLEHYASGPLYGFIYFIIADSMNLVKIGATNQVGWAAALDRAPRPSGPEGDPVSADLSGDVHHSHGASDE